MAAPLKFIRHRDLRELARVALAQGWRVEQTKTCHVKWFTPDGRLAAVSTGTPCGGRGYENALAQLRRAGLDA